MHSSMQSQTGKVMEERLSDGKASVQTISFSVFVLTGPLISFVTILIYADCSATLLRSQEELELHSCGELE